jgi:hypothetical protein
MKKLLAIVLLFVSAGLFADNPGKEFVGKWVGVSSPGSTITIEVGKAGYIWTDSNTGKPMAAYISDGVLIVSYVAGMSVIQLPVAISADGLLTVIGSQYKKSTD